MLISIINQKIFNEIKNFIEEEESFLKSISDNKNDIGIYYMPELAFAYEVGKRIFSKRKEIFSEFIVVWKRETSYNSQGPSDLSFECYSGNVLICTFVIEFKLVAKLDDYKADIIKLNNLDDKFVKLACVLIDTISDNDIRLMFYKNPDSNFHIKIIDEYQFITKSYLYKNPINANLILVQTGNLSKEIEMFDFPDGTRISDEFDSIEDALGIK